MTITLTRLFFLLSGTTSFLCFVASFVPNVDVSQINRARSLTRFENPVDTWEEKKSERGSDLEEKDEKISELDARVLQSMLQDGTVDVGTEENLNKLLERATTKYTKLVQDESDSEFNSRILQTVSDTKLWKGFSAKADDFFGSAVIFLVNRAQRDSTLLASIGVFAWERAVRDVARAIPAAGFTSASVGRALKTTARQLGSSSSFQDVKQAIKKGAKTVAEGKGERKLEDVENLYDELNTPLDEIKSVTQSIRKILAGETPKTTTERGLRSAAPAGAKKRTERQQRAYQKRKQTVLKQEKEGLNVGRISGNVVDVAWEVKRDLETETNRPGYKTERVRNAIAAGAETTSRVIAAAREGDKVSWSNILFGSENEKGPKKALELDAYDSAEEADVSYYEEYDSVEEADIPEVPEVPPMPSLVIPDVLLPAELLDEQQSVAARLESCIESPESTWLTPDVLLGSSETLDPDNLGEVVTTMICARDDLKVVNEVKSLSALSSQLKQVKNTIDFVVSVANSKAGSSVSNQLNNVLYGVDATDDIPPTLLAIEDIKTSYLQDVQDAKLASQANYETAVAERERLLVEREQIIAKREKMLEAAAEKAKVERLAAERAEAERVAAEIAAAEASREKVVIDDSPVDVLFEKAAESVAPTIATAGGVEVIVEDGDIQSTVAEVIIDTDFETSSETVRTITDEEDDDNEKEPNLLIQFALRSLDVVFVVFEKVVVSGLPSMLQLAGVASKRMDEASRGGLGRIGWTRLANTEKGTKRY
mmetsp:Transcript_2123/g.3132  ORF Transcript_2123/g.3132 Transcript_2123/m.3132 type:complete len:768 (-) Transcript_2123:108-2411(-)|eukprot:CAMPEP_0194216850 /NCGR_PEP_ID=MMETSP0156-20130528/19800_1 /TAXON_ID=33649 /ORGANISM="Thalassionema nitzschioides, Strain L26-B" /LENGTH=767 /DNA_ID=CAMNT_0038945711 /DNA_START=178 /DNA_END=2481 /DNA_ORIENTATION=-